MKRIILIVVSMAAMSGSTAIARLNKPFLFKQFQKQMQMMLFARSEGLLGWKVGDTLHFSMQMKPLPKPGTMTMTVTKDEPQGFTLVEDINAGILKQKAEVLVDRDTGEIKKMTVNGKPAAIPDAGSAKMLKEEESRITVAAGTFDAIHIVTQDEQGQISEAWVNPAEIPINGILKTRAEQSILEVNTELVSFARGK